MKYRKQLKGSVDILGASEDVVYWADYDVQRYRDNTVEITLHAVLWDYSVDIYTLLSPHQHEEIVLRLTEHHMDEAFFDAA